MVHPTDDNQRNVIDLFVNVFLQGQSRAKATMPPPLSKVKAVLIS